MTSYSLTSIFQFIFIKFRIYALLFKQIRYEYKIVKDTIVIFYTGVETLAIDTVNCHLGALLA